VASASSSKLADNQLLSDLIQALGCGTGTQYRDQDLRYEKVVIMTDADVDGAHIASLLITFFYQEMRGLIDQGHLYLAVPPLYRLSQGGKTLFARDDAHKEQLMMKEFNGKGKVDVSRFKGLGEMPMRQLKETTMDPSLRTLLKVEIVESERTLTNKVVDQLMGNKPEARFKFIQERAEFAAPEVLDI
jgi:topoisomerase-4 subunit B